MIEIFKLSLVIFTLAAFVGALPWPHAWHRRKPLSCDVCMATWCTGALGAAYWLAGRPWALGVSDTIMTIGLTILLLRVYRWLSPIPMVPEIHFPDEL